MNRLKSINKRSWLSSPYVIWIIGFTVIPMFVIFRYALTSENDGFTLSQITAILDPVHLKALVFSLQIAIGSTLICILLSYPLVMAMKRLRLGKQGFALFILDPADVDEFYSSDSGMADDLVEQWNFKFSVAENRIGTACDREFRDGDHDRYGL